MKQVKSKVPTRIPRLPTDSSARVYVVALLSALLVACQPTVYLMPAPVALTTGEIDPFAETPALAQDTRVLVLYATNRYPLGAPKARVYSIFPHDVLRLGVAHLRIGGKEFAWQQLRAISTGAEVERRPALVMDKVEEWAAVDAGSAQALLPAEAKRFFEEVNQALAASRDKDLMIYVHGANANVYRASAQAAQYRHFTGRNSVVLVFAWPSAENLLKYGMDVKHAAKTAPVFAQCIELLSRHTEARNINILAYSAGAQVASPGLAILGRRASESVREARRRLRIGEVYYAAPDVNFKDFVQDLSDYLDLAHNVTLAANLNDNVLAFAQLHHGVSRAGRPDLQELSEEQTLQLLEATRQPSFDVIFVDPATIPGLGKGSHSFWYDHPWVSTDVLIQFLLHARPGERALVENRGERGAQYWTFPPDYDTRIVELLKAAQPRD